MLGTRKSGASRSSEKKALAQEVLIWSMFVVVTLTIKMS
jgi:hypothetical protein